MKIKLIITRDAARSLCTDVADSLMDLGMCCPFYPALAGVHPAGSAPTNEDVDRYVGKVFLAMAKCVKLAGINRDVYSVLLNVNIKADEGDANDSATLFVIVDEPGTNTIPDVQWPDVVQLVRNYYKRVLAAGGNTVES
jgi:hypothetical protein